MLRLIVKPHKDTDRFEAFLDGELITTSRQPLLDGARKLVARGYEPDQLLTMRHHNRGYDSFKPKPIGELAKWTVKEPDRGRMQLIEWKPYNGPLSYPVASPAADNELAGIQAYSVMSRSYNATGTLLEPHGFAGLAMAVLQHAELV